MNKINAVIMAGAPAGELNPEDHSISRAMIALGDKTMLQWVVNALQSSESIGRIVAVGNVHADGLDEVIMPCDSLVGNLKLGLQAVKPSDTVLVVSCDIPMLTSAAVEDFISRAVALDVDMAYPVIPKQECEKHHPELKRTYLKTGDGTFTGGNLMLVKPAFFERNWSAIEDAYAARKQIGKLAHNIGVGVLLRVILGQLLPFVLRISALERAVSRMLRGKVAAVISAYPEIGEDVDKPSDLAAVRAILAPKE
jgi:GTP:adenosylcobinamide-phosphate guanylyltransferase